MKHIRLISVFALAVLLVSCAPAAVTSQPAKAPLQSDVKLPEASAPNNDASKDDKPPRPSFPEPINTPNTSSMNGLLIKYYNSMDPTGTPNAIDVLEDAFFELGDYEYPFPGIGSDFSAEISGFIIPPVSGRYWFTVKLNYRGTVEFDGDISEEDDFIEFSRVLSAGEKVPVTIKFRDETGSALFRMRWQIPDSSNWEIIPSEYLQLPDGPLPAVDTSRPENDICVPDISDPDIQFLTGMSVDPTTVFSGSVTDINALPIVENDLYRTNAVSQFGSLLIVVPIGYQADYVTGLLPQRIDDLNEIMRQLEVPVTYWYVNKNMPVTVVKYGNIFRIPKEQIRAIRDKLVQLTNAPFIIMFDVNAEGRGSADWTDMDNKYVITHTGTFLYTSIHETFHIRAYIWDGYFDTFYSWGDFPYNTELYLSDELENPIINPEWEDWFAQHKTNFVDTGWTCLGRSVLRPEGEQSIMSYRRTDVEIFHDGVVDQGILPPFQRRLVQYPQ